MNDRLLPPDEPPDGPPGTTHDDELLSRLLDGHASAEDQARVDADPRLAARFATLRAITEELGRPVPPLPEGTVDAMVALALDAAEPEAEAGETGDGGGGRRVAALPIGPARSHRSGPSPWTRWLTAAAVVVVLGLAAVGVAQVSGGRSDSDSASGSAGGATAASDRGSDTDAGPPAGSGGEDGAETGYDDGTVASTTGAPVPEAAAGVVADLGAATDAQELAERAAGLVEDRRDAAPATAPDAARSALPPRLERCTAGWPAGATPELVGVGQVDGTSVDVVVLGLDPARDEAGSQRRSTVLVLDGTCAVLAERDVRPAG